jgi:hypothetical protein
MDCRRPVPSRREMEAEQVKLDELEYGSIRVQETRKGVYPERASPDSSPPHATTVVRRRWTSEKEQRAQIV